MIQNCCAFTGHRPKKLPWKYDETDKHCINLKKILTSQIIQMAEHGVTEFLSGMAEGADTWAALIVLELQKIMPEIKLHCVIPYEGQADDWSESSREQYHSILKQADTITYVHREYCKNCMLDRNRYLVDNSAYLLAVYNGEFRGGTAATVRYARKQGKDIVVIHPVSGEVSIG